MVLEQGNHLVDSLLGSMALALGLPDLLGVAAALGNEVVDVEHGGDWYW